MYVYAIESLSLCLHIICCLSAPDDQQTHCRHCPFVKKKSYQGALITIQGPMPSSLEPTYLIIMMSQIQGSESVENYQQLYY